jgi:probable rRNA maturation factor
MRSEARLAPHAPRTGAVAAPADPPTQTQPSQRLNLTVVAEDGDWSRFFAIDALIGRAGGALSNTTKVAIPQGSEASIVLGDDALLRRLNGTYRGKDAPTNVLSFPFQRPPGNLGAAVAYLGDVVLAAETILREADERAIEPAHHLQHLVVHGLLHLLGYDHETAAAAQEMERLETDILATIGVADPYGGAVT